MRSQMLKLRRAGGCLTCRSEGPIMVDRVSPVR